MENQFITNISGKVRNTKLPKAKALWPLFEVVSNSIHAIEERFKNTSPAKGKITIIVTRFGNPDALAQVTEIQDFPIKSFTVLDNGIGFNSINYTSFLTSDSEYKIEKGAKGIGRFVCLKAFREVRYESVFEESDGASYKRAFVLRPTGEGIFDYAHTPLEGRPDVFSCVVLHAFHEDYQRNCPRVLRDIAYELIEHFLVTFITNRAPQITIQDEDGATVDLNAAFTLDFKSISNEAPFRIGNKDFKYYQIRMFHPKNNHTINYCAVDREVVSDNLTKLIPDLGSKLEEEGLVFTIAIYVTGAHLNENVDSDRTSFLFPDGSDEIDKRTQEITLNRIRTSVLNIIEEKFAAYLEAVRGRKFAVFENYIKDEAPEYLPILKYRSEKLYALAPELSGGKLELELHRIKNEWESEIRKQGQHFLHPENDITDLETYRKEFENYFEQLNDLGKSNLAKHIIHRKIVIKLLEQLLGADASGKFPKEDLVHNIFFPIRADSDEISFDKQNLWLIDERLAFHSYLGSDKHLKSTAVESGSDKRLDLLIFNDSFAFVNDDAPHNSFVIVEFKRPERDDYHERADEGNPIDQVLNYILEIRESKAKDRRNRYIDVKKEHTPFYAYIVCDFTPSLKKVLSKKNFTPTPDGMGYFFMHTEFKAYIEVISYPKLLKDAKQRNRMLFEKLGIAG